DLRRALQPIAVEMPDRSSAELVGLHQGEGRARHLERLAGARLQEGAREGGLAGAEIAPQRDHVADPRMMRDGMRDVRGLGEAGSVELSAGWTLKRDLHAARLAQIPLTLKGCAQTISAASPTRGAG